jgi:hypothetical protein
MREISSSLNTAVTKLWSLLFFGFLIPAFLTSNIITSRYDLFITLTHIPTILISFLPVYWAFKIKQVVLTEKGLLIFHIHFGKRMEMFVPFENIENISQKFYQRSNIETVSIKLNKITEFGSKIVFMPKIRFLGIFEHPIVGELNQVVERNRKT